MIERDFLYVGGEWIEPASGQTTEVIYPFTEEPIGRAALAGSADVDRAVRAARAAFDDGPWPRATAGRASGGPAPGGRRDRGPRGRARAS